MHSICGGTGGGLGTVIALELRDNYPDKMIFVYSTYPSLCFSSYYNNHRTIEKIPFLYTAHNPDLETYNTALSLHQLIENTTNMWHHSSSNYLLN